MSDEIKSCIKCGVFKPLSCFRIDRGYVRNDCKTCAAAYQQAQYAKNPTRHRDATKKWCKENKEWHAASKKAWRKKNPEKQDAYARKANYGITDTEFKSLLVSQEGVCAICGGPPLGRKNLSVDHCHKTGKVRALLCGLCNTGLGNFRDASELLLKAHAYLLKFSS